MQRPAAGEIPRVDEDVGKALRLARCIGTFGDIRGYEPMKMEGMGNEFE
jgi:hypothetical protein